MSEKVGHISNVSKQEILIQAKTLREVKCLESLDAGDIVQTYTKTCDGYWDRKVDQFVVIAPLKPSAKHHYRFWVHKAALVHTADSSLVAQFGETK